MKLIVVILICLFVWPCLAVTDKEFSDLKTEVAVHSATLHEYKLKITEILDIRQRELINAAESVDKRLAQMNEFRAQLDRQANTFLTKEQFDVQHADMNKQIANLQIYQANQEGRMWVLGGVWTILFGLIQGLGFYILKKNTK